MFSWLEKDVVVYYYSDSLIKTLKRVATDTIKEEMLLSATKPKVGNGIIISLSLKKLKKNNKITLVDKVYFYHLPLVKFVHAIIGTKFNQQQMNNVICDLHLMSKTYPKVYKPLLNAAMSIQCAKIISD